MGKSKWRLITFIVVLAMAPIATGCGGDDDDDGNGGDATTVAGAEEAAALQEEIAGLRDGEQIKRVGDAWADPFAAGDEEACSYMHPDVVTPESCAFVLSGQFTQSVTLQRTYAGATVADVTVKGETAQAEFSNGERVDFRKDPEGEWKVIAVRSK